MYWVNQEHEDNFKILKRKFPQMQYFDAEYTSACYCASHPHIFEKFDHRLDELKQGPFDWFFIEEKTRKLLG